VNYERIEAQLLLHEGCRLRLYKDTKGLNTIGVGYNVAARTMAEFERIIGRTVTLSTMSDCVTREEALKVLRSDILRVEQALRVHFPTYDKLNEVRQRVLLDMAFNMGLTVLTFKDMLSDVVKSDWSGAAKEIFRSKFAYQVDDGPGGRFGRADRLSYMLLTGTDVTGANAIPGLSTV
jgi:lysozyme